MTDLINRMLPENVLFLELVKTEMLIYINTYIKLCLADCLKFDLRHDHFSKIENGKFDWQSSVPINTFILCLSLKFLQNI